MAKYPFMVKRNGKIYPAGVDVPMPAKETAEESKETAEESETEEAPKKSKGKKK